MALGVVTTCRVKKRRETGMGEVLEGKEGGTEMEEIWANGKRH